MSHAERHMDGRRLPVGRARFARHVAKATALLACASAHAGMGGAEHHMPATKPMPILGLAPELPLAIVGPELSTVHGGAIVQGSLASPADGVIGHATPGALALCGLAALVPMRGASKRRAR